MNELGFTAEDVKRLRDDLGISIFEAKRMLMAESLLTRCENAQTVDDLKVILKHLIERSY